MKIVHTVSSLEEEASGPTYSVPRLCRSLAQIGCSVDILSLSSQEAVVEEGEYRDIRIQRPFAAGTTLARLGVSRKMKNILVRSEGDVFHTHGLWMMPNVYPATAAIETRKPFVLAPRGMLGREALQFSKLRKQAFWTLLQGRAARRVTCFHATAMQEYDDIRAFGLTQPVAVIPNGVDLPMLAADSSREENSSPFVLSLGRVHPKKGLDRLIRAWALVEPEFQEWRLKIVGPSEIGHAEALKKLVRELNLDTVEISGPVFGDEKIALLAEAELFALSTLHENFGMTVAESLAVETPVISTKGAPWQGLTDECCGWWVEHGPDHMALALKEAMSLTSTERRTMGARGRAWMERDFGWEGIARRMADVYAWALGQKPKPDCIMTD
ncbi:glycosyltransferase [Aquamicrobium soli]|uniref:Glycosyltransferase n=1 Tax=Aquamicrobium soli TaxID=1811518 RepID=A0ABV7KAJ7_9HYPH